MPQDVLSDGFVQLCIDPSLNFYDGKCRVLVEGQFYDPGEGCTVVADQIVPVTSLRDVDCRFGAGSVLAESLKKIFCECPKNIEVHALPREDPAAGVAAVYDLTITGPATSAGLIDLYLFEGDYSVALTIDSGDAVADIAAKLIAALPANFPYTTAATATGVTFTARNDGEVGNYLTMVFNWRNRQGVTPAGVTMSLAQTTPGSGDLPVLDLPSVLGVCCYSCIAVLSGDNAQHENWERYLKTQWDCDGPQCFGHAYTYAPGTPAQVLSRFHNSAEISKIAHCPGDTAPPWFKVAAYAAKSCCTACDNPELSIQGRNYGVLTCIRVPGTCTSCYSYDEQLLLRENNFVVTGPLQAGAGQYTSPYIFNDVTNNLYDNLGRRNATFWDVSSKRLIAKTAIEIAAHLQTYNGLGLFTKNTTIKEGVFGTNPRLIHAGVRAWAKDQVGTLFSEFDDIDNDIQVKTDFEVASNCQGNPNHLHLLFRYRQPSRVDRIITTLQPDLLDNCDR